MTRPALLALLASALVAHAALHALAAGAQPLEPPPEAPEGADYTVELADSLDAGALELGVGFAGDAAGRLTRRRRVRFAEPDFSGTVREGAGDPLAGGAVESRGGAGSLSLGRLAPRWGRGLLLGTAAEPWERAALDRGGRARYRGRAGEGLLYRRAGLTGVDALFGRFGGRDLGGLRVERAGLALGVLGRRRALQTSLGLGRGAGELEIALDPVGRWRAEGMLERRAGNWWSAGGVRAGHAAFRSLAEPRRSGPPRALLVWGAGPTPPGRATLVGALWRHRPDRAGARLGIEIERALPGGASLRAGFEEQHGVRRDTPRRAAAFRQGAWTEWRSPESPLRLALRHEAWGDRRRLRGSARVVSTVRIEGRGPRGARIRLTHGVFRVRGGESLYLGETETDRVILRAVSGEGQRTRLEVQTPLGRGRVHASLALSSRPGRPGTARWTLEWSRRSRPRSGARPRAADSEGPPPPRGPREADPTDFQAASEDAPP